jgi:hypothetical protein
MLTETELYLNRFAQGAVAVATAQSWFESQSPSERQRTLQVLAHFCQQSHPLHDEAVEAIGLSGLKPTFTPCVLLSKAASQPEVSFGQIIKLPEAEQIKSFRLLASLFAIADTRRRKTQCNKGCTHEWHNLPAL